MTQTKAAYRVTAQNVGMLVNELNFVLQQVSERLDGIEGLRGNPKFFSTTFDFQDTVSGVLSATGSSAAFETLSAQDLTATDITTVQGLTAGTQAYKYYDADDQLIHSFGATT